MDVLAIAVRAVLAQAESFEDIVLCGRPDQAWSGRLLELPNGVPSLDFAQCVPMAIEPGEFERGFLAWTRRGFVAGGGEDDGAPPHIVVAGRDAAPLVRPAAGKDAAACRQRLRDEERTGAGTAADARQGNEGRDPARSCGRARPARHARQPRRRLLQSSRGRGDHGAQRGPPHHAEGQPPGPSRCGAGVVRRPCRRDGRRALAVLGHPGRPARPGRRGAGGLWPARTICPTPPTSWPPGRACAAWWRWRPSVPSGIPRRARRRA